MEDHPSIESGTNPLSALHKSLNASATPFPYPLASLGLGLFDADPSRILSFLHHQTLLAEEALR